jgi:hypothetical protein
MARTSWGLSRISGERGAARQRCPRLWRVRCVFMYFEPPCAIPLTAEGCPCPSARRPRRTRSPGSPLNERFRPPGLSRAPELISLGVSLESPRLNAAVGSAKPAAAAARPSDVSTGAERERAPRPGARQPCPGVPTSTGKSSRSASCNHAGAGASDQRRGAVALPPMRAPGVLSCETSASRRRER